MYSQAVLLALVDTGMTRDNAYRIVQRNALATWDEGGTLEDHLAADPGITLDEEMLAACFTTEKALRNADVVFDRLAAVEI